MAALLTAVTGVARSPPLSSYFHVRGRPNTRRWKTREEGGKRRKTRRYHHLSLSFHPTDRESERPAGRATTTTTATIYYPLSLLYPLARCPLVFLRSPPLLSAGAALVGCCGCTTTIRLYYTEENKVQFSFFFYRACVGNRCTRSTFFWR